MDTQKPDQIIYELTMAFTLIGEPGLAFAVKNLDAIKAAYLSDYLRRAGFIPTGKVVHEL